MTDVRCPACSTTVTDPTSLYPCPACGRRLRWRSPNAAVEAVQLGLFGEAVPAGAVEPSRRRPRRTPASALDRGVPSQSPRQNHQDALVAATILFHDEDGFTAEAVEQARALLVGQATADLRQSAFGAVWMLAVTLRTLERHNPGFGADMLQALGLSLAVADGT